MEAHSALASWESFYVIVGSSGAALTGLQFVVMALIAELETPGGTHEIAAFGTPTIIHFGAALLVSAIISAPWPSLHGAAIALIVVGVVGTLYTVITTLRAGRTKNYKPVLEDWVFHSILPFVAYFATLVSAIVLPGRQTVPLFVIGGGTLLLLFIGIHNAWDTVTYVTLVLRKKPSED